MVCMLLDKNAFKLMPYGAFMACEGDKRMEKMLEHGGVGLVNS